MSSIPREIYPTAEAAFKSFNAGKVLLKCRIGRVCRRMAKAFGIEIRNVRATERLLKKTFKAPETPALFTNSISVVQARGELIFFTDASSAEDDALLAIARKCALVGLQVYPFIKEYTQNHEFQPPPTTKMVFLGYHGIGRGILVGMRVSSRVSN